MRLITLGLACVLVVTSFASAQTRKRLIEFGWDEPDTAFMRQHIAAMEQTPFDGTVFHLNFKADDGSMQNYVWHTWSARRFELKDFQHAIDDLKATPFKRFTHNFLRFNTSPANVDWFDDPAFSAITSNARLAARIAREGRAAGILFDIEQYNEQLFNHAKLRDAKTKSFDDYAAKARQRGREVMAAFQEGFPDLHIILTFGHTLPYTQVGGDEAKLATVDYGLAAPFLDGLFDGARGESKIVDGFELSYGYKMLKQFHEVRDTFEQKIPQFAADPEKFKKHGSLGFGLWLDNDWRNKAWDEHDYGRNHFTPMQFEASLHEAWNVADHYVWIYTETPKWWTAPNGKPEKLPHDYVRGIRQATGK
jgi:hypothetical protein